MRGTWIANRLALRSQPQIRNPGSFLRLRSFRVSSRISPVLRTRGGIVLLLGGTSLGVVPFIYSEHALSKTSASTVDDCDIEEALLKEDEDSLWTRLSCTLSRWFLEPILTFRRFIYLFLLFSPVLLTSPLLLLGPESINGSASGLSLWWYKFLTRQMQCAGPTFVKLGQWAASRTDLFPAALCDRLGALHSHGKPHSFGHTRRLLEKSFQKPFEEIFESFDMTPIGVGAIAQVYRAVLKHDLLPPSHLGPRRSAGSLIPMPYPLLMSVPTASVAIKVLHPQAEVTISRDLSIMRFFATLITLLPGAQWLSLPEEVEVFGRMMNGQLDLRNEANNLLIFERNFESRKAAVTFPRPLKGFSSSRILVEEFQNALPLEYFLQNGGGPYDDRIAQIGLDAFLNMLLLDNFVHSDLHPGNIMVKFYKPSTKLLLKRIIASLLKTGQPPEPIDSHDNEVVVDRLRALSNTPNEWNKELHKLAQEGFHPELVFIDTGLVTELNERNRRNFIDLFGAIAHFDGYQAGLLMIERCRAPHLAIDRDIFALKIQHLLLRIQRETFSLARVRISDVLNQVLRAVRQHHVKMEGDFINTVLSVLLLEGIGRRLDPSLDLFSSSLPILRRLGRQMSVEESLSDLPRSNFGALLKVWIWAEARSLASAAFLDTDALVRYDLVAPNV